MMIPSEKKRYSGLKLYRDKDQNVFSYSIGHIDSIEHRSIPFKTSTDLTKRLLEDTLNTSITRVEIDSVLPNKLASVSRDSVLQFMMTQSDNFIAEQLLYNGSFKTFGRFDRDEFIQYSLDSVLHFIKDRPKWVDGSGLSRYNLATPYSLFQVLRRVYENQPKNLFLLAKNGEEGTLKNRLTDYPVFFYGKTGTLSNNHSIAGIFRTKSRKDIAIVLMYNHYKTSLRHVYDEIDAIISRFYLEY